MSAYRPGWQRLLVPPRVDPWLSGALLVLVLIGLAVLHSAAAGDLAVVRSQALRDGAGLVAMLALARVPPARLRLWAPWFYAQAWHCCFWSRSSAPGAVAGTGCIWALSTCSRRNS